MSARIDTLRTLAAAAFLLCFFTPAAPAETDTATVCGPVERLDYHLRVDAPRSEQKIRLYWEDTSMTDCIYAQIMLPERFSDESGIMPEAKYEIHSRTAQTDKIIDEGEVEADYGSGRQAGFSVIIRKRKSGCILELGGRRAAKTIEVPFDYTTCIRFFSDVPQGLSIKRNTLAYMPLPQHLKSTYTTINELLEAVKSSKDSKEGIWKYLDRKTDKEKAEPGGKYTLACVKSGTGYDLIYLEGDSSGRWEALEIKAHLEPSGFIDNYDLTWYTADGRRYDADTNASFTTEGHILECRFPEVDGMIRFKRLADYP